MAEAIKILIVDDEENARLGLSKLLSQEGYDVATVGDGFQALDFLRSTRVNLVITDMRMPGMNGLSFLREVSRHFPSINIIMMTAYGGIESYFEAMNLGAYEYINKPVKLDELKSIMSRILQAH